VAGRTSSFSFRGKSEDLASIAGKLHVATVLEGSVRKSGNRVRVTAQLINAQDGFHLWSKEYDRELTDIFKVQDELAASVVEALKVKLLPGAPAVSRTRPPRDPEAYRLALLGRSLLLQQTEGSLQRAEEALEKAVAIEPSYGKAWGWLAAVRGNIALVADRDQVEPGGRAALEAIEHAIAADPDDAADYGSRAWIRSHLFWDWSSARADIDRAMELGPSLPDVLNAFSTFMQKIGRLKEAIAAEQKLAALDPIDVYAWTNLAALLAQDGQLQAARDSYARSLEISPDNSAAAQGVALIELLDKRPAQAVAQAPKMRRQVDRLAFVAMASHDLGRTAEALHALDSLRALAGSPQGDVAYATAAVYAWWGERDLALQWLERAYARHDLRLRFLKCDPLLRAVRGDPRYHALVRKVNLPAD
jgi:Tfp pilus assembly protein PilF